MMVNPELAIPGGLHASPYNLLKERKKRQWNVALNHWTVVLKSETTEVWFKIYLSARKRGKVSWNAGSQAPGKLGILGSSWDSWGRWSRMARGEEL